MVRFGPRTPMRVVRLPNAVIKTESKPIYCKPCSGFIPLTLALLLGSCAAYGPYHANVPGEPIKSIRGPEDGRYKMAIIEFGDEGSPLDNYQRKAALEMVPEAKRPLLFVYIHGWQNSATSADVCRFEHFLDSVSRSAAFTGRNIDVRGVYVAWRGLSINAPVLEFFTFWDRKATGEAIAAANSCLSTLQELAVVAREPGKEY